MSHYLSDGPLPFGKLDLVQSDYREFACSWETAEWLLSGGMTHLDGLPVVLSVSCELRGGHNVMVKAWCPVWAAENGFELAAQFELGQTETAFELESQLEADAPVAA